VNPRGASSVRDVARGTLLSRDDSVGKTAPLTISRNRVDRHACRRGSSRTPTSPKPCLE
jgi:hypothetical protein